MVDLSPSWFDRRNILQNNSKEYEEFITKLKREHAIEIGIVEGMYDLERGVTETFIKEGFVESYKGDFKSYRNGTIGHRFEA